MKYSFAILILLVTLATPAYSAWNEHQSVEYVDLVNNKDDFWDTEILLHSQHGAGSGHYLEMLRIYKDVFPELALIFECRTLDQYSDASLAYEIISEVSFGEQYQDEGMSKTDIIVTSKKVKYKHDMKTILSKEDLGKAVFVWNGKKYIEKKQGGQDD